MAKQLVQMKMSGNMPQGDDPVQAAMAHYMSRMTNASFDKLKPTRHGTDVSIKNQSEGSVLIIAASVAFLLPAVSAARGAARRAQSMNNLKQIGLALLSREVAENAFPSHAIFDKQGKPLLSWRVQILPYLDQAALYERFHLDEPWDSAHNKPLIALMPSVYQSLAREKHDGTTTYLAPVGKGLAFEGDKKLRMEDFRDGTSNTISGRRSQRGKSRAVDQAGRPGSRLESTAARPGRRSRRPHVQRPICRWIGTQHFKYDQSEDTQSTVHPLRRRSHRFQRD